MAGLEEQTAALETMETCLVILEEFEGPGQGIAEGFVLAVWASEEFSVSEELWVFAVDLLGSAGPSGSVECVRVLAGVAGNAAEPVAVVEGIAAVAPVAEMRLGTG